MNGLNDNNVLYNKSGLENGLDLGVFDNYISTQKGVILTGIILYLDAANKKSLINGSTTWFDLSSSGNNGTLTNGPIYYHTRKGIVYTDGVNDHISTTAKIPTLNSDWTVCFWFNINNSYSSGTFLCRANSSETYQARWEVAGSGEGVNAGKLRFLNRNGTDQSVLGIRNTSDGAWHFACFTNSSSTISVYLDGCLENSAAFSNLSESLFSTFNLYIARTGNSTNYYHRGYFSIVMIYNRSLTNSEVLQNYQATRSRFGV